MVGYAEGEQWDVVDLFLVELEDSKEGFLRDFNASNLLHAFFPFFLSLEQLPLSGDITTVAFRSYIFSHGLYSGTRDDSCSDSGLDGNFEELTWDFFFQFSSERLAAIERFGAVCDNGKCVDRVAVDFDVESDEVTFSVIEEIIVQGGVATRYGLEFVVEVESDFSEG